MRSLGRILAGKVRAGQVGTLITDAESPNGEYVVGNFLGGGGDASMRLRACFACLLVPLHAQSNSPD